MDDAYIPPASYRVLGAVPLGEGVAENAAGGWSEGKASPSFLHGKILLFTHKSAIFVIILQIQVFYGIKIIFK